MGFAIVIDVSVARAAGTSGKPAPEACRNALAAIRDYDHRVAMSRQILAEWMKKIEGNGNPSRTYASHLSLIWLVDMKSKNRVDEIEIEDQSAFLQRCIQEVRNTPRISNLADHIAKDFHLVETALQSDRRVLSNDMRMFSHLGNLVTIANEVCGIMWVSPTESPAVDWLKNDTPEVPEYHVCTQEA